MVWMESSKCSEVGGDLGFGQNMHTKFRDQLANMFPNITMSIQRFATRFL